jgi:HSP20 family protein
MNNKKLAYSLLVLSFFVTATCLFATYYVYSNAQYAGSIISDQQVEMRKQLEEKMKKARDLSLNQSPISFVLNEPFGFPTREFFTNFEQELDKIFEQQRKALYQDDENSIRSSSFMVDNKEKEFKVSAILQNVTKDMLDISIHDGYLTIKAEKKLEKETKTENTDKKVFSNSRINKVIKLPRNADVTKSSVTFADGVLVIKMPKTELKDEKPIKLEVK